MRPLSAILAILDLSLPLWDHVIPALLNKPAVLVSAGYKKYKLQLGQGIQRFEDMVSHSDQIKLIGHIERLYNYVLDKDKEKLKHFNVSLESVQNWEDTPQVVEEINKYAKVLEEL